MSKQLSEQLKGVYKAKHPNMPTDTAVHRKLGRVIPREFLAADYANYEGGIDKAIEDARKARETAGGVFYENYDLPIDVWIYGNTSKKKPTNKIGGYFDDRLGVFIPSRSHGGVAKTSQEVLNAMKDGVNDSKLSEVIAHEVGHGVTLDSGRQKSFLEDSNPAQLGQFRQKLQNTPFYRWQYNRDQERNKRLYQRKPQFSNDAKKALTGLNKEWHYWKPEEAEELIKSIKRDYIRLNPNKVKQFGLDESREAIEQFYNRNNTPTDVGKPLYKESLLKRYSAPNEKGVHQFRDEFLNRLAPYMLYRMPQVVQANRAIKEMNA